MVDAVDGVGGRRAYWTWAVTLVAVKIVGIWMMRAWPVGLMKAMSLSRPLFFVWLLVQACWLPLAVLAAVFVGGRAGLLRAVMVAGCVVIIDMLTATTFQIMGLSKCSPLLAAGVVVVSVALAATVYGVALLLSAKCRSRVRA